MTKKNELDPDNKNSPDAKNWLVTLLRRRSKTATPSSDTIAAQVGDGAKNIVVGKDINVIQIGGINIPRAWLVMVVIVMGLLAVIGVMNSVRTREGAQDAEAILEIVSASTPTATPTPMATPVRMPTGSFNIAVADFALVDKQVETSPDAIFIEERSKAPGLAASIPASVAIQAPKTNYHPVYQDFASDGIRGLATGMANFLVTDQAGLLAQITTLRSQDVVIWGPDESIMAVEEGTEELRAKDLNADILIYGTVHRITKTHWELLPNFYIATKYASDQSPSHTTELLGRYTLGTPIVFQDNPVSLGAVNRQLQTRVTALTHILFGLSNYEQNSMEGYQTAIHHFEIAADDPAWGGADTPQGQEVISIFQVNAYLSQRSFFEHQKESLSQTDIDTMQEMLNQATDAYNQGLMRNEASFDEISNMEAIRWNRHYNLRLQNAIASILEREARLPTLLNLNEDQCKWDWEKLAEAEMYYQSVLDAPNEHKVVQPVIDLAANLGIGRSQLVQTPCFLAEDGSLGDHFPKAEVHLLAVIEQYENNPNIPAYLIELPLLASADLGGLWLDSTPRSPPEETPHFIAQATYYYTQAIAYSIELGNARHLDFAKKSLMPLYLFSICINNQFNNQDEDVGQVLEEFVSNVLEPEQARRDILANVPEHCRPDISYRLEDEAGTRWLNSAQVARL